MNLSTSLSDSQLQIAQILWSQYEKKTLDVTARDKDESRQARLIFAGKIIGHEIESFQKMTRYEAHILINSLKKSLGLPITVRSRVIAEDRGLQGRSKSPRYDVMASREDMERIESAIARLEWNEERYRQWLGSPRSPLKGRMTVRTQADANRVWWALKKMLQRAGRWA